MKLVIGQCVVTDDGTGPAVLTDGAVAVDGDRIVAIGSYADLVRRYPRAERIGGESVAVLPGLINAHHHGDGVGYLQHGLSDGLLEAWLKSLAALTPQDPYLATLFSAAMLLRSGITTVVDLAGSRGTPEESLAAWREKLRAYRDAGIRVALAPGYSTRSLHAHGPGGDAAFLATLPDDLRRDLEAAPRRPDLPAADYVSLVEDLASAADGDRLAVWYGPPGPQWVSDDTLQRAAEAAARRGVGVQTHANESLYEALQGPRAGEATTVERLDALGVLSNRFSIAHGCWLTPTEIGLLAQNRTMVAHNPSSNLRLRAGITPLPALRQAGVGVALGLDATALGDDDDMFAEMRLALRLHRSPLAGHPVMTPRDVFAMATCNGADLLQRPDIGRLTVGAKADLTLVDLGSVTWPWTSPDADMLDLIVQRATARDVTTVLVDGETVWRNGEAQRFDLETVAEDLAARMQRAPVPAARRDRALRLARAAEDFYAGWTPDGWRPVRGEPMSIPPGPG